MRLWLTVGVTEVAFALAGCASGDKQAGGQTPQIDPTPEKLDGSSSHKFESEDIERAENADPEVVEYCDGAVSEAQRLGFLSHVEPEEIP